MALFNQSGERYSSPIYSQAVEEVTLKPTVSDVMTSDIVLPTQAEIQAKQEEETLKVIKEYEGKHDEGVWTAAFKQENSLGSWISAQPDSPFVAEEGYNPYANPDELTGYEKYTQEFMSSKSPAETQHIKTRIDEEVERKKYLSVADNGTIASITAGVVDPITAVSMLIPGGAVARGAGVLRATGAGMVAGATDSAITEIALHGSQLTRTGEESLVNIGIGSAVGAVLGGAIGVYGKKYVAKESQDLTNELFTRLTMDTDKRYNFSGA